jgi:uncharacterized protein
VFVGLWRAGRMNMGLKQRVEAELKQAMKARDPVALGAARLLKSAIVNREIELGKDLAGEGGDAEVLKLVEKQLKQRREAAGIFAKAGRTDLAEKEEKEAAFLASYLPKQLTAEELEALVATAAAQVGATSIKEMGLVMKAAQALAQGRADGKALSEAVKRRLSSPVKIPGPPKA